MLLKYEGSELDTDLYGIFVKYRSILLNYMKNDQENAILYGIISEVGNPG